MSRVQMKPNIFFTATAFVVAAPFVLADGSRLVSSRDGALFLATYVSWSLVLLVEPFIIARGETMETREKVRSRQDSLSMALMSASFTISLLSMFLFRVGAVLTLPPWSLFVGMVVVAMGIAIRTWAVFTLSHFFSYRLRSVEAHRIVNTGLYRWVRHPSYSGLMMSTVGLGLASGSGAAFLVTLVLMVAVHVHRIHVEEQTMLKEFGKDYADYMKGTKRVIPFVV